MHPSYKMYFWDGRDITDNQFIVNRIFEYARFDDLIHYPFTEVQANIDKIPLEKLRTGEKRKQFLIQIKPYIHESNSWEEAIWKMVAPYFERNKGDGKLIVDS